MAQKQIGNTLSVDSLLVKLAFETVITATSGWSSNTVYQLIMPENTLLVGCLYKVLIRVVKPGTGQFTQCYDFPVEAGSPGSPVAPDLASTALQYYSSAGNFKLRPKVVATNLNTWGLEGTFSDPTYAGATVSVKILQII